MNPRPGGGAAGQARADAQAGPGAQAAAGAAGPRPGGVPPLYAALLDDAALFPPGEASMDEAVEAHLRYRRGPQEPFTGPFVVPAGRLAELGEALRTRPGAVLRVSVTVPEGPAGVGPALEAAAAQPAVEAVAVEVAAAPADDDAQAAANVSRAAAALEAHLPARAAGFVELPRGADPRRGLDALSGTAQRAKLRTGGTRADAFPKERELAAALCAAAERGRALKCTAGLHHAVRHTDAGTGFEHQGLLNVLLAVHAALQGAGTGETAGVLSIRDPRRVAADTEALDSEAESAVRALFASLGTCSVVEPLGDLVALGRLSPAVLE